jgi:hypothetical protein
LRTLRLGRPGCRRPQKPQRDPSYPAVRVCVEPMFTLSQINRSESSQAHSAVVRLVGDANEGRLLGSKFALALKRITAPGLRGGKRHDVVCTRALGDHNAKDQA